MSEPRAPGSLAELLLALVPAEQRAALEGIAGLEELLREHLTAARAAWPQVTLEPEAFIRHVARHLSAEGTREVLRQLHAADLYLACACATGSPAALRAFEQHVLQVVPTRLGTLPRSTVDEALQVLRERMLMSRGDAPPKIATYSGRGSLLAWVVITAARIASELASRDGRRELPEESPEALEQMLASGDPEHELLKEDSRQLLKDVLKKVLAALPERERALLRMHHLHGFTMDQLATMHGESRSGVARRVAQARERLMKLVRTELGARLGAEGSELESLLGLVQSRLDLSLHRLMD